MKQSSKWSTWNRAVRSSSEAITTIFTSVSSDCYLKKLCHVYYMLLNRDLCKASGGCPTQTNVGRDAFRLAPSWLVAYSIPRLFQGYGWPGYALLHTSCNCKLTFVSIRLHLLDTTGCSHHGVSSLSIAQAGLPPNMSLLSPTTILIRCFQIFVSSELAPVPDSIDSLVCCISFSVNKSKKYIMDVQ